MSRFCSLDERVEAQDERHKRLGMSGFRRFDEARDVLFADGDGLLQKDMLARLHGENGLLRMLAVRRADGDDVDAVVVEDVVEIRDGAAVEAELRLFGLDAFEPTAAERDDFAGGMFQIGVDVSAGDPAATPDGATEFSVFHDVSPMCYFTIF